MEKIKKILHELRPELDFEGSSDFIEDGYLDSFDIMSLISIIEETFGVSIDGVDILPENFASYEAITDLIKKSGEVK